MKMKKIFGAALALISSVAFATTLVPVQLLNPTGSSSGQAIVSTGSSSAPAWGGVGVNGIAAIAANTVLANATSGSASPTAFAMPSCSSTTSALQYTTNTGITCNTGMAPLASPALTGTPTAPTAAIGTNTTQIATTAYVTQNPTIQGPNIIGFTNGSTSNAGSVGELPSGSTTGTSMSNGTAVNCTSKSLTAGDWLVWGAISFSPGATTTITGLNGGLTTTSATLPSDPALTQLNLTFTTGNGQHFPVPMINVNVTTTTTVYLVGDAFFGTSTMACNGYITALRFR